MIWSFLAQLLWLCLDVVGVFWQSERHRAVEVILLRQQWRILERKQRRPPRISRWEKLTLAVLAARLKGRGRLNVVLLLFKPETVLKWHRELVRRKWTFQHTKRRAGHAALDAELEALIVQVALDNPRLDYKKLVGELRKLGYRVGRSTVRDVLKRHSIQPAPERRRGGNNWRTFINSHKAQLLATDFFSVETVWLQTVYVLFFIELNTRQVHLAGCTTRPTSAWVTQPARQFVWKLRDSPQSARHDLIHDRDTKFTASFDAVFESEGLAIVLTPPQAPNANAFAERWIRSVREECLDHWLIFSQRSLNGVLTE